MISKPTLSTQKRNITPPEGRLAASPLQPPTLHAIPRRQHSIPQTTINNPQHHFPNKEILNSLILLTPKPPTSLLLQTVFQSTQAIFLRSSLPPKKKTI